jgi:dipeptidyl aminopeptidase/acylaminoacyl peptidase
MRSRAATGAAALALAVACAGVLAGSASATYPGADGRLVFFAAAGCPSYSEAGDPCNDAAFNTLITVAPDGGPARQIARCPGSQCSRATRRTAMWSPDGRLLAAEGTPDQGSSEIAILSADGTLVRLVPVPAAFAEPLGWLPDGRRVAVLSGTHVLTVPAAGGPARALGAPYGPRTWSVRGDVAISNPAGVYVRRAAGRRRLLLHAGKRFLYGRPDWSPDGRRLAVVRTDARTGLPTLLTVPASGGRSRVVVRGLAESCRLGDPVWAPSGTRLAFAATCLDGGYDLARTVYTVRRDGSRLRSVFDPSKLASPSSGLVDVYVSETVSWQARP